MNSEKETPLEKVKRLVTIRDVAQALGVDYNSNYMCVCPIHKDGDASLKLYPDNHFYCYGCGRNGDSVDLVMYTLALPKAKAIAWIFDNIIESPNFKTAPQKGFTRFESFETILDEGKLELNKKKVRQYVLNCELNALNTPYFKFRGLNTETIKRFHLGYDEMRREVVIPYNRALTYYQSRGVSGKFFRKLKSSYVGKEPIFNVGAFLSNKPFVFIVESPFCAMSIYQCGGVAVPLCGTQNVGKFLSFFAKHKFTGWLIISLDNDDAGREATQKLCEGTPKYKGLKDLNIKYKVVNVSCESKDPNELLVKNEQKLKEKIMNTLKILEGEEKCKAT